MKKGIRGAVISLALLSFLTALFFSCNPITGADVLQGSDTIAPVITITSPADGSPYAVTVTVTGIVSDEADAAGSAGRVDSLSWELTGTILGGTVTPGTDGAFSFSVSTVGLNGTLTLKITAVDWNGNSTNMIISLASPKEITSFAFLVTDNPETGLSADVEGTISGTAITVPVPGGTDVRNLVAVFATTGTEVNIGTVKQISGETSNNFTNPRFYVVKGNDQTTKTYTVTASATPLPPTGLALAGDITVDTISLSWTDKAHNETGYVVQRKISESEYTEIGRVSPGVGTGTTVYYDDTTFFGSDIYYYRVAAENGYGLSAWDTTQADVTPEAPVIMSLEVLSGTSIRITWNDNSTNEEGFRLYRKIGPAGEFTEIEDQSDSTPYEDTGLSPGINYTYRVLAYNNDAASLPSDEELVTILFIRNAGIDISNTAEGVKEISAADLDDDGDDDILAAIYDIGTGGPAWYENRLNEATADFSAVTMLGPTDEATSICAADLDGDGYKDIISVKFQADDIIWFRNDMTGGFSPAMTIYGYAESPYSVYSADLDGDGDKDVLSASSGDDSIVWYENDGAGVFSLGQLITDDAYWARSVFAADLDGDDDLDVLSAASKDYGWITWYENDGTGTFSSGTHIDSHADGAYCVYAADLDEDGDNDVLAAISDEWQVTWYENDGNGVFSAGTVISSSAQYVRSVYAADLDNDGDLDVLSASSYDDRITWYENQGGGVFSSGTDITNLADMAYCVYAADLDNDGDLDVLSASSEDDRIVWYENLLND